MRSVLACLVLVALAATGERAPAWQVCLDGACPALAAGDYRANAPSASVPPMTETCAVVRIANLGVQARTLGSGTLVDVDAERGVVVTCAHLFREQVGAITVTFADQQSYVARLAKIDLAVDLAALVIAAPQVQPVELAESGPVRGQPLVSCGYGGDGRLWCNEGTTIGYVQLEGNTEPETLEWTGSARFGDSGGPAFDRQHRLVAVLFGTNGRVVDGTFCGRVRKFLTDLCPRLAARIKARRGGGAKPLQPMPAPNVVAVNPSPISSIPAPEAERPREPACPSGQCAPARSSVPGTVEPGGPAEVPQTSPAGNTASPTAGAAADSLEALAKPWLTARLAALLIAVGVPAGAAGLVSASAVWLVMRRGRRRLEERLKQAGVAQTTISSAAAASPASGRDSQVIERHHNRYVPYELSELDKAWAAAHAHVGEKYPGAVPYLKIAEGVKEQLLSGIKDPQVS